MRDGIAFCLSLPLDFPGGNSLIASRSPPVLRPTVGESGLPNFHMDMDLIHGAARGPDVYCDDAVLLTLQYSTKWDSFAHVGQRLDADGDGLAEILYYNGFRAGLDVKGEENGRHIGALKLGIDNFATKPIQGRAVMIDLAGYFGTVSRKVTYADIAEVTTANAVRITPGDMVLFHTGFADALLAMDRKPDVEALRGNFPALDGRDPDLLCWIADSGVSALVADNVAVETLPNPLHGNDANPSHLPLHTHCLFKLGIPLGELWHLGPLAAYLRERKRRAFLLTAPPLRLPRAVGSPVTPVATV